MQSIKRTTFFISMPLGFISLIFPIYAISFGARGMEIGLLYSIFSIISIIMRPMVGSLIDNRGRRIGILLGVVLYLLANLCFFIANDSNWLLLARIIQSFGASFLWLSIDTYIADISDIKNRSTNYAINGQIVNKGGFIGSFIGFNILLNNISDNPFRVVFMIFSLASFLALYFGFKDIKETNYSSISNDNAKLKRFKYYKHFLTIIFIKSFIVNLTTPIFLLYLQDNITNDIVKLTFLFVPATLLSMFLPRKFGQIADNSSRERIIFIGFYLIGILQIFIPFTKSYNGFMILYIIISILDMFYGPAYSSLIIDFVGEDKRGSSYGLYSLANSLGAVGGPIIGGFIYENVGKHIVFYLKGVLLIALISFVCYIYYRNIKYNDKIERQLE
ncbi:MAG: MFS transporter [Tissierellaceae bacterium]|nr:MFS transporter [Tissierellaceae bacterium]